MQQGKKNLTLMGLITLGIVYGDIGTSPLYVMTALINDAGGLNKLSEDYIIGCLSLVFTSWSPYGPITMVKGGSSPSTPSFVSAVSG